MSETNDILVIQKLNENEAKREKVQKGPIQPKETKMRPSTQKTGKPINFPSNQGTI